MRLEESRASSCAAISARTLARPSCLVDSLTLLVAQLVTRLPTLHRLGVNPAPVPVIKARDQHPTALRVEQRHGERVVAAGVVIGVEAHPSHVLQRAGGHRSD